MEILQQKRALELLYNIFSLHPGKTQFVNQGPQKAEFPGIKPQKKPLTRATPEAVGMRSGDIMKLLSAIADEKSVHYHSILILRHGKVVAEMTRRPYSASIWHVTYSMCKTVTAIAVGMLIDDGKLSEDAAILDFFPEIKVPPFSKYKNITVRHLLTMSSGVSFAEAGSVTENDWVNGYFNSVVKFEPGTEFSYNSMNSYILSAIVTKLTGMTMSDFLKTRLFEPLGIEDYYWESSPTGVTKGGWGLYLLPEDMAKLGILLVRGGMYDGKRIISEAWCRRIGEKAFDTPEAMGRHGYASHAWCGVRKNSVNCNGLFGQNVFVYPDIDVVIVTTAAIDSLFQTCAMTELIEEFVKNDANFSDSPLPPDGRAASRLQMYCRMKGVYEGGNRIAGRRSLFPKRSSSVPEYCRKLDGSFYALDHNYASLLPLMCQMIQNNYSAGVDKVGFEYRESDDAFYFVTDEDGERRRIPVGFGDAAYFDFDQNGESYKMASHGVMTTDEDGRPTLKIYLYCLEGASERTVKIFFCDDGSIKVRWNELPGKRLIINAFEHLLKPNLSKPFISAIASKADGDYLLYRLDRVIEPVATGVKINNEPNKE